MATLSLDEHTQYFIKINTLFFWLRSPLWTLWFGWGNEKRLDDCVSHGVPLPNWYHKYFMS